MGWNCWFEPENRSPQNLPGVRLFVADARRFARVATNRYDVIVADLFHPSEDGAGFLYTLEHFEALRGRLAPGGLVCQWLPLHQLSLQGFRDVARTFREAFPTATLWLLRPNVDVPVVGLVGTLEPLRVDPAALDARMRGGLLAAALPRAALNSAVRALGQMLAGPEALAAMSEGGEVSRDDRPVTLFREGASAYRAGLSPARKLMTLLDEAEAGDDLLIAGAAPEWAPRLAAYRRARDFHLRGLEREEAGKAREAVEHYVESARSSADYTAGYAQAVLVATAFAREERQWSMEILRRLAEARPEQQLAGELLRRMTAGR
jgi:spermidine synthase